MHGTTNPTLFYLLNKTFDQAAQERPDQTERYCSMDNSGNKVS